MNVYERAIRILKQRGWTQGYYSDPATGAVCALGAVGMVRIGEPWGAFQADWDALTDAVVALGWEMRDYHGAFSAWNDAPERSLEDVLLVLKHAASEADR